MVDMALERSVPLLCVHDVRRSIAFYRDVLGSEITGQFPDPSDDPGFAHFQKGAAELMVNSDSDPSQRTEETNTRRSSDVTFYFWTRNVETLRESLQAHGVEVGEIRIQHYGMKQLPVEDPDGYRITFQEPVSGQVATGVANEI